MLKVGLDKIGIGASMFCALHCLTTPFLILLIPVLASSFFVEEKFETAAIVLSFILAMLSLGISYFTHHRKPFPLLLASVGFCLFALGKTLHIEMMEVVFSVCGGCCVAYAHYRNLKITRSTKKIM